MVIKGFDASIVPSTAGFVGIGLNFANPLFQLDVNDNTNLNINYISNPGFGYRINGVKLLSSPTGPTGVENIFVGRNAGASWNNLNQYSKCTFLGENTGQVNIGVSNTFLGTNAGALNTFGPYNTFVGEEAGVRNTAGEHPLTPVSYVVH